MSTRILNSPSNTLLDLTHPYPLYGASKGLASSAGALMIKESYSAYGARRSSNWATLLPTNSPDYSTIASTTRRGYSSAFHELLDNVGLIHLNGRVSDPVLGRFLSPDPIVGPEQLADSQGWNPYSYVGNRPLSEVDPTGLYCTTASSQSSESDGSGCDQNPDEIDESKVNGTEESEVIICATHRPVFCFDTPTYDPPDIPSGPLPSFGSPSGTMAGGSTRCPKTTVWPKSVGYSVGAHAFAGMGNGAAASGSGTIMVFSPFSSGRTSATTLSGGLAVSAGSARSTTVPNGPRPFVAGAAMGLGPSFVVSNASGQSQLEGSFHTIDINAFFVDLQISYGGGIWQASLGEASLGLGVARYDTATAVQSGGCTPP